ncbi:uncharacterized protein LOC134453054 [Engraulis encrasicolus]|uniref:uncharacterized protein LOC134453054 n=1 Tax=Engraulis encrasicolus TaxID=184585 RepID=UPI002FD6C8BA
MPRRSRRSYAARERERLRKELWTRNGVKMSHRAVQTSQRCLAGPILEERRREILDLVSSVMYLAHLQHTDETRWTFDDVMRAANTLTDQITKAGSCSLNNRYVNFNDLPEKVQTHQGQYCMNRCKTLSGSLFLKSTEGESDSSVSLLAGLRDLGTTYSQALLMVGASFASVFQDPHGQFGFFHSRSASASERRRCCEEYGVAAGMESFATLPELADRLVQFFGNLLHLDTKEYSLLPVSFTRVKSEQCIEEVSEMEETQNPETQGMVALGSPSLPRPYRPRSKRKRDRHTQRMRYHMQKQLLKEGKKRDASELKAFKNAFQARYYNEPDFKRSLEQEEKEEKRKESYQLRKQRQKLKYHTDPAFREKTKEYSRLYYQLKKTRLLVQEAKEKEEKRKESYQLRKQRQKLKYHTDPAFREKTKEYSRLYYQLKKTRLLVQEAKEKEDKKNEGAEPTEPCNLTPQSDAPQDGSKQRTHYSIDLVLRER